MWVKLHRDKDFTSPDSPKCTVVLDAKYNKGKPCSFAACYKNTETGETLCGIHYRSAPKTDNDPSPPAIALRKERERKHPQAARIIELRRELGELHPQLERYRHEVEIQRSNLAKMEAELKLKQDTFNVKSDELSYIIIGGK